MRILFCNYEYPPLGGGGGVINAMLAQEMAKNHQVTVLTSQGLDLPEEGVENGVRVIRVPVFFRQQQAVASLHSMLAFIPMGIKKGKELLRAGQYDVINTHFVLPTGPVGDTLARLGQIPNVLSLHGGDLYDPSKAMSPHHYFLLRFWIKRLLRRADVVLGQSKNTLANMRRFYTPEIAGKRIPLAIPKPPAGVSSRVRHDIGEDEVLLATVGRLIARKGIVQLISMMEALREERVRLLIMGTGPQEQLLKEETRKKQLEDKILFLGYVEEAEKFGILRMSDIYVSTSQHEGFGLVFLEAMACGLPIVCYDHGGQTDFLQDEKTGYLIALNNLDRFRESCISLLRNPGLRKTMGAYNQRYVEEFYIENCALKYESVLREAIELNERRLNSSPQVWLQRRTVSQKSSSFAA